MAEMTIDEAVLDTSIGGGEMLPESDAGSAKKVSIGSIKDYVLAELAGVAQTTVANIDTDGVYVCQSNVVKRMPESTLANAIISWALSLTGVVTANGNEKFSVDDAGTKKTITLAGIRDYVNANISSLFSGLSASLPLGSSDYFIVKQGSDVRKGTLGDLAAFALGTFATYVTGRDAVATIADTDVFAIISGGVTKRVTGQVLKASVGNGNVTCDVTTTTGHIPCWGATDKKLTDGYVVSTSVGSSGGANSIPTEEAVRTAINAVSVENKATAPATTTQNKVPQWSSVQKTLTDGLTLVTTVGSVGSDSALATEKAVRTAINGVGDVKGPTTTTSNNIPQWDSQQKKLKDGVSLVTSVGSVGSDSSVATEKAVRSALNGLGDVKGPVSTTADKIPQWDSTQKMLKDGLNVVTSVGVSGTDANIPTEKAVRDAIGSVVSVGGPITTTQGKIPRWDATNRVLADGISLATSVGATGSDDAVATEKAVRTAITASMGVGAPASHSAGNIPAWDATNVLTDGYGVRTSIRSTAQASDLAFPTEKAVRTAVNGCITAPASHTENAIPQWGAANELKAGKSVVTVVGSTGSDDNIPTEKAVRNALPVAATTAAEGLMSAADKTKLDNLVDTSSVAEIGGALTDIDTVVVKQGDVLNKKALLSRFWTYILDKLPTFAVDAFAVPTDNTNGNVSANAHGFCPKLSGSSTQFLRGDGTFATPAGSDDFTGTDGTTAGVHGLVPAPATTDVGKFLNADGTWTTPPSAAGVDIPGATAIDSLATGDLAYFFDVSNSGYRKVTAQQILDFVSGTKRYDTIFIPAGAMTPSNTDGATPGAITFTNTTHDTQAFTNTKDTSAEFSVVFPDDWDKSTLKFKAVWTVYDSTKAETGQHVKFNIGGVSSADGETITTAPTTYTDVTDMVDSANEMHKTAASAALTLDGTIGDGNLVHFRVVRDADYAPAGGSPMPTEALLLGIVVQFGRTNTYTAW